MTNAKLRDRSGPASAGPFPHPLIGKDTLPTDRNCLYSVRNACRISAELEYPSSCVIFSGGNRDKVSARMVALM
ncbi:MAG: hypothetical protein WB696_08640, partial [Chthoniobacterales bacterium]